MMARPIAAACLGLLALQGFALAQSPQPKDTIVAALAAEGTVLDPARYSAGSAEWKSSKSRKGSSCGTW